MTKQDEKLRLRRRLQDQAVDQAAKNRWEEAVETNLQLINLGEDADTTGAVCGQFAGACYGVDGIPDEWLAKLAKRKMITDFAAALARK